VLLLSQDWSYFKKNVQKRNDSLATKKTKTQKNITGMKLTHQKEKIKNITTWKTIQIGVLRRIYKNQIPDKKLTLDITLIENQNTTN
jgi:hypothetical protein